MIPTPGDPVIPTPGDPMVPIPGDPMIPTLGDPMIPILGDLMIPFWEPDGPHHGDLPGELPACHLAPKAQLLLLLHLGLIAHIDVFVDDFIGAA